MGGLHLVTGAFVAPLAPAAGLGAGALITILAWLICFTLAYIWRRSFGAMLQWLADEIDRVRLPAIAGGGHVFGAVSNAFRYVDNAVEGALVYAANATEHAAVWLFHKTAGMFDQIGRELGGLAYDVSRWGSHLIHATIPREIATGQRLLWHSLRVAEAWTTTAIRTEAHAWRAGVHRLTVAVEHDFGIARRGIDAAEREARTLARRAEREATRLSRVEKALGVAAFAGAVGLALDRWLGRWWRCPSLRTIGKHTGCKGFKFLEDMLLGVIDVLVIADLCRITGLMVDLAETGPVKGILHGFIDGFDKLVHCRKWGKAPKFAVRVVALPPEQARSALPPVETDLPLAA